MPLPEINDYPERLRYRFCPMCTGELEEFLDEEALPRVRCSRCGWIHYTCNVQLVNIVITTKDGIVFLFPPGEPPECPAALPGGVVEYGEAPEEAAVREAREETGLEVEIVRTLGRVFFRSFIFEARMIGGALRDGLEGRVAAFKEGAFPAISRNRRGSRRALQTYFRSRRQAPARELTKVASWHSDEDLP
jgi:hypothetical protein